MLVCKQLASYCFLLLFLINTTNATHLQGTFHPQQFFKFLIKFGFQKTEKHSQKESYGYIYGNITSDYNFTVPLTFAVLDKEIFTGYYGNRSIVDREEACQKMFGVFDNIAFDKECRPAGQGDYLRRIPCPKGGLCADEDTPGNIIKENQFTFIISDLTSPRFWYLSIAACYRNTTTCKWHYYDHNKFRKSPKEPPPIINYDFYLVNGNPNLQAYNPLVFQFSFEQQNILEMYLIFLIIYLILVPMQFYAVRVQQHPVTKLFTASLCIEFVSLWLILIHMFRYAINGVGNESIKTMGDIFDIFSRVSFMLILLLLAKGWAVTRQQISKTDWITLMSIWVPYCGFNVFLYVWNRTEVDIISDVDEYQTWPGWLVLACRSAFMLWFLWELRNTMNYEHSIKKLDFLLHFGASSLVWFIYLPIVALIALQVSPLWRYKLLLGITNAADCLAYCVMTGLLWPNRSGQYLLLAGNYAGMDELDEFNEAPHVVHGDTVLPAHNLPHDDEIGSPHSDMNELLIANVDLTNDLLNSDDLVLNNDEDDDDIFVNPRHNLLNSTNKSSNNLNNNHINT